MEDEMLPVAGTLPVLAQNTHLDVSLDGWPAAVAITAVCGAAVMIVAILAPSEE